ncbi:TetR/AcrR family transcriptional regulator [Amycolatopsis sp. NPDC059657]|uniref:TetR/AcrR family transcriptional regulator n=1 Tax=Amycolatopsis sp. NPDC059657 TaxID=3346899 RepID=UPI0036716470
METRERILDVAVELFAEVGYDKAGIRELASRLGFTTAALYYHFRNKQEILTALAESVCQEVEALAAEAEAKPATAERSAGLLASYYGIVMARPRIMTVLESSMATLRSLEVGKRMAVGMERLSELLAVDDRPESRLRAEAALGILTTLHRRASGAVEDLRPHLLAAAYGALVHPVAE